MDRMHTKPPTRSASFERVCQNVFLIWQIVFKRVHPQEAKYQPAPDNSELNTSCPALLSACSKLSRLLRLRALLVLDERLQKEEALLSKCNLIAYHREKREEQLMNNPDIKKQKTKKECFSGQDIDSFERSMDLYPGHFERAAKKHGGNSFSVHNDVISSRSDQTNNTNTSCNLENTVGDVQRISTLWENKSFAVKTCF